MQRFFWNQVKYFRMKTNSFIALMHSCPATELHMGMSLLTARCEIIWIQFSIWWKFWLLDKWADILRRKVASCKKLGWALVIYQGIVNHQYKQTATSVSSNILTRRGRRQKWGKSIAYPYNFSKVLGFYYGSVSSSSSFGSNYRALNLHLHGSDL